MNISNKVKTAACLIIGNEIMTGKTKDTNMHHLAVELFKNGIDLIERYNRQLAALQRVKEEYKLKIFVFV